MRQMEVSRDIERNVETNGEEENTLSVLELWPIVSLWSYLGVQ